MPAFQTPARKQKNGGPSPPKSRAKAVDLVSQPHASFEVFDYSSCWKMKKRTFNFNLFAYLCVFYFSHLLLLFVFLGDGQNKSGILF
jgi:hypothetical protein